MNKKVEDARHADSRQTFQHDGQDETANVAALISDYNCLPYTDEELDRGRQTLKKFREWVEFNETAWDYAIERFGVILNHPNLKMGGVLSLNEYRYVNLTNFARGDRRRRFGRAHERLELTDEAFCQLFLEGMCEAHKRFEPDDENPRRFVCYSCTSERCRDEKDYEYLRKSFPVKHDGLPKTHCNTHLTLLEYDFGPLIIREIAKECPSLAHHFELEPSVYDVLLSEE